MKKTVILLFITALSILILLSTGCTKADAEDTAQNQPVKTTKKETPGTKNTETATVGKGTIEAPAKGPSPAYNYGNDIKDYVLVKNWDFGKKGTIRTIEDMSKHFQYHDQFGTIANGTNYGAKIVSPDKKNAIWKQPIELKNTKSRVREFFDNSLKTYLAPLDDAKEVHPTKRKAGCGSFQAKWTLPTGGVLLGKDMIWETRVRYKTPPYFWFAIWCCGNEWDKGAEMDLIESFGYDNGGGYTNFDGRYWHSSSVGGKMETDYHKSWGGGMKKYGIKDFDASQYHTWTWVYKADDTWVSYLDGKVVQKGSIHWTRKATRDGKKINMSFIFDGSWGHSKVQGVNKPLAASKLKGTFYEWDYSRVYLRNP